MRTTPGIPQASKNRLPKWLKVTLFVFGVLFVIALIFGESPADDAPPAAAPTVTVAPTTTTPASAVPQPAEYVVAEVSNGNTVKLTGATGPKTARVLGLETPPPTGESCFRAGAYDWAKQMLTGKEVLAVVDDARDVVLSLALADGTDYVAKALETGHAKYATDVALGSAAAGLRSAEAAAKAAGLGLWAAPCDGVITSAPKAKPEPAPRPAPEPVAPPKTTTKTMTEPPPPAAAYYKNCDAARAAGAAPLRRGEPGYRAQLDRDDDGVACE
ncbi:thermonuclease family protein [Amycolatopsis lurida]